MFVDVDATQIEVNPLGETDDGRGNYCKNSLVSMIRKYHNHKLQTNRWHREGELHKLFDTLIVFLNFYFWMKLIWK